VSAKIVTRTKRKNVRQGRVIIDRNGRQQIQAGKGKRRIRHNEKASGPRGETKKNLARLAIIREQKEIVMGGRGGKKKWIAWGGGGGHTGGKR